MYYKRVAQVISVIFHPFICLLVILYLLLEMSGLDQLQKSLFIPIMLLFQIVIPGGYIVFAKIRNPQINWDFTDRRQRYPFFILYALSFSLSLIFVKQYGNQELFSYYLILFSVLISVSLINFITKISGHLAGITTLIIFINYFYEWRFIYLIPLIIMVGWSRHYLGRHNVLQIVLGALVSAILVLAGLTIL